MAEEAFDPLLSRVSPGPIGDLRWITGRARALLRGRSTADVRAAQSTIESWRAELFEEELDAAIDSEIQRLEQAARYGDDDDALEFFDVDYNRDGVMTLSFRKAMEGQLSDLPNMEDSTRLEALQSAVELYLPLDRGPLANWAADEFYAAHALSLIAEAEAALNRAAGPEEVDPEAERLTHELTVSTNRMLRAQGLREVRPYEFHVHLVHSAFNAAIEALDAVGKAELSRASMISAAERQVLSGQVAEAKREASIETVRRKDAARHALGKRHEGARQARRNVLAEWEKDRNQFPSAERAGDHFANWLEERGQKFQQRTVRDWIRAHASKMGIAFR